MFFCVLCIFLMGENGSIANGEVLKSERFGERFEREEKSPNLNHLYLSRVLTLFLPRAQFEFENRCNYYVFVNIFSPKCNCALLVPQIVFIGKECIAEAFQGNVFIFPASISSLRQFANLRFILCKTRISIFPM